MRVGVFGPAHEGRRGDQAPLAMAAHDVLSSETVLDRHDRGVREPAGQGFGSLFETGGLRRDDGQVEVRQLAWIRRRGHPRGEVVPAADLEPSIVQRLRMLSPAREHGHVCNLREMRGEEAADRARTDDACLHANFVCRYFRYGSGSMPDPVTRRSRSDGAYRPPWR